MYTNMWNYLKDNKCTRYGEEHLFVNGAVKNAQRCAGARTTAWHTLTATIWIKKDATELSGGENVHQSTLNSYCLHSQLNCFDEKRESVIVNSEE